MRIAADTSAIMMPIPSQIFKFLTTFVKAPVIASIPFPSWLAAFGVSDSPCCILLTFSSIVPAARAVAGSAFISHFLLVSGIFDCSSHGALWTCCATFMKLHSLVCHPLPHSDHDKHCHSILQM